MGGRRHSQKIARQRETHDLAAAVRQQFVKAQDAFKDTVERGCDILLREHGLAGGEADMACEKLDLLDLVLVEQSAHAQPAD
jgi:hypothetical protein